jgi:hypothetical protein
VKGALTKTYYSGFRIVFQPTDERYERPPLQEAHPFSVLWVLEIAALAGVGASIIPFILEPSARLIALAGVVFFGLLAVFCAFMLVWRWRTAIKHS